MRDNLSSTDLLIAAWSTSCLLINVTDSVSLVNASTREGVVVDGTGGASAAGLELGRLGGGGNDAGEPDPE